MYKFIWGIGMTESQAERGDKIQREAEPGWLVMKKGQIEYWADVFNLRRQVCLVRWSINNVLNTSSLGVRNEETEVVNGLLKVVALSKGNYWNGQWKR